MPSAHTTLCISIVSHAQGKLVYNLLSSLEKHCQQYSLAVVVTLNVAEDFSYQHLGLSFPVTVIKNKQPKGFGTNHNTAFKNECKSDYFCVLNPDILFLSNPFPILLSVLDDPDIGVVGPSLVDSHMQLQDSARKFPTPKKILRRRIRRKKITDHRTGNDIFFPDWIAGMFMLFPVATFSKINGFDERYFMYCEDADICLRLKRRNLKTACAANISAIHDARRSSHRSIQHFHWHLSSLFRFFIVYSSRDTKLF